MALSAVGPWLARLKALVTGYSTQGGKCFRKINSCDFIALINHK